VIKDFKRGSLAIEVGASLRAARLVTVLERLKKLRGLPDALRVDNGTEILSRNLVEWYHENGIVIGCIETQTSSTRTLSSSSLIAA
jgi:putative transposase